ncbi:MAG: nucleoside-diphosphate sugar epimerase, partial [Euryarchaeota archaeon]|nr:nucleoside-diphosphate sugar epimerase [Euryarchaeota archaeon]
MKIPIPIWGKALNLYRPYLSLKDAYKTINYIISKNFYPGDVFNVLSENKTVKQILDIIKKNKIKIDVNYINSKIINKLSFKTSKAKIEELGLKLN